MSTCKRLFWLGVWIVLPYLANGQTITAKLAGNPIIQGPDIPLSATLGLEVGVSKKSSFQADVSYREYKDDGGVSDGWQLYLNYRYYPFAREVSNTGFYISPFVGYGVIQLSDPDEAPQIPEFSYQKTNELGFLLGVQPIRKHRFSVDLFFGPAFQWQTQATRYPSGDRYDYNWRRLWMRGGFYFSYRIKR